MNTFMWVWLAGKWFWWTVSTGLLDGVTWSWSQNTFSKRSSWSPPIDWASMLHMQVDKHAHKYQDKVYRAKESNSRLQNALAVTLTCPLRVQELLQSGTPLGCLSMGARPGGGDGVLCVYPCTPGSRMLLSVAWAAGWSNSWDEKPGKKGWKFILELQFLTSNHHSNCGATQTQQEHAHWPPRGLHTMRRRCQVLQQWHLKDPDIFTGSITDSNISRCRSLKLLQLCKLTEKTP